MSENPFRLVKERAFSQSSRNVGKTNNPTRLGRLFGGAVVESFQYYKLATRRG